MHLQQARCPPLPFCLRHSLQVRGGIQQALELVATEAAGEAGRLPEPAPTAEAVEAALFKLYGELPVGV